MSKLVIIRGLPGSGKTTMAKTKYKDFTHYEADVFFMMCNRRSFSTNQIAHANALCQENVKKSLLDNFDTIITSIFMGVWELTPYLKIAKEANSTIEVVTATGNYKSSSGIPVGVVNRLREKWEEFTMQDLAKLS